MPKSATQKKKTYDRGILAETLAATYLKAKNYKVLETRYKTSYGEIDLIIQRGDLIAFVEVKARQSIDQALESISSKMRMRIQNAALHYMSENPATQNYELRFDVVAVKPPLSIHHLENAWLAQAL